MILIILYHLNIKECYNFLSILGNEGFEYLQINEENETNIDDNVYGDLYPNDGDDYGTYEDYEYNPDAIGLKIVGGNVAKAHTFPFAAVLTADRYKEINEHGHFCGGTLITSRHVVTAAHCFQGDPL